MRAAQGLQGIAVERFGQARDAGVAGLIERVGGASVPVPQKNDADFVARQGQAPRTIPRRAF